jgi:hypothetical protein
MYLHFRAGQQHWRMRHFIDLFVDSLSLSSTSFPQQLASARNNGHIPGTVDEWAI